ncbi:MAG: VIT1/CCC1 family protein [Minisyncoccia bacterium]|jgi:VIT1/CCC1 family predicted Fe2+/Mn2+ transporter
MNNDEEQYLSHARNEITEHYVYHALARREKKPENKALLQKLSAHEKTHYEFWKELLPGIDPKPHWFGRWATPLLASVFGVTFTAKWMESHEKNSTATYRAMLPALPAPHKERLQKIIEDEQSHEQLFIGQLREKRVAYVGFVALGLADAIVEITGVHAGFLGVTGSTLIAGISGVIVGFAAAISMGSAAYLQAKQDPDKSPVLSAFITGISYMVSVICLALPYFLIHTMLAAFVTSASVGIVLLAAFTFYGAIIFDRKFVREFAESASLMLGTALATYLLGKVVGATFHIGSQSF